MASWSAQGKASLMPHQTVMGEGQAIPPSPQGREKQRLRAHLEHVARCAADDEKRDQQNKIREDDFILDGQDDRPEGDGEVGIGLALVAVRESPVIQRGDSAAACFQCEAALPQHHAPQ